MASEILVHWICDGCKAQSTNFTNNALPVGWVHSRENKDLCPVCFADWLKGSPWALHIEAGGQTIEDLIAVTKEVLKDLQAGYLQNLGAKKHGNYTYKVSSRDQQNHDKTIHRPDPTAPASSGDHWSI